MQTLPATVVVLGTGGTISGSAASPEDNRRYVAGTIDVATLVATAPGTAGVRVETEQVAQLDSKDMDFATWRRLAERVAHQAGRDDVAGVVVTHGTDTLEETAYFLSRVVAVAKPVVLTGAMHPATSSEADGPGNLGDAIALAALPGRAGVVVAFAGKVHSARDVRKVNPWRLDAFSSGEAGPLGRIVAGRFASARERPVEVALGVAVLPAEGEPWPWVEILTSAAGACGRAALALIDAGVDGIVVAATGNGTLHRELEATLRTAADRTAADRGRRLALLRATRCFEADLVGVDDPEALQSAGDLTPVKARIELILRLLDRRGKA